MSSILKGLNESYSRDEENQQNAMNARRSSDLNRERNAGLNEPDEFSSEPIQTRNGVYEYNVPAGQEKIAKDLGLDSFKGHWFSRVPVQRADFQFGRPQFHAIPSKNVSEAEQDFGPDYQDKVTRLGQMAKQGERKTVWDPVKRVYKTVPVNPPKQQGVAEEQLDELSCWSGYHRVAGTKAGFPGSCAKNKTNEEDLAEQSNYDWSAEKEKIRSMSTTQRREYALARLEQTNDDKFAHIASKAGAGHSEIMNAINKGRQGVAEEQHSCPHCGGEMVSEELMNEKKDACYYKVKSRYKVWPSAYASGALVKCRKSGADSWGNGGKKNEGVAEGERTTQKYEMMMRNGQVKKFIAKDDADAKRIAAGHGAKSVIRLRDGVPAGKVSEQGVAEEVNPEVTSDDYTEPSQNVRMGDFVFNARTFTGALGEPNAKGLQIRAYEPKNLKSSIGSADFIVKKDKKGNQWLESDDTEVNDEYRGKGVATMMYAFAKSLGNDIKDSPYKSKAGSDMWKKWGSDAKHLVGEQGVAEEHLDEKWTKKYKDSINCSNPKGFSQKAHCAGKQKNESSILEGINRVDESLHDWFNKEKWVRMDTKGNIKGPCAKEPGEGKPKCLPQAKAHSLGKKGRASAASRKRREDPNPERSGKAINVDTKKSKG